MVLFGWTSLLELICNKDDDDQFLLCCKPEGSSAASSSLLTSPSRRVCETVPIKHKANAERSAELGPTKATSVLEQYRQPASSTTNKRCSEPL